MRTYLPYADFDQCAKCFTMKRLTKQRHDVMELLYMLDGQQHPMRGDRFMYNSPPKKVWQHCPTILIEYGRALCREWSARTGRTDPIGERLDERENRILRRGFGGVDRPKFLNSEAMQKSHRAILARQDEKHYSEFGFQRDPDDEKVFYWPVDEAREQYEGDPPRPASNPFNDDDDREDDFSDDSADGCDCESCRRERGEI